MSAQKKLPPPPRRPLPPPHRSRCESGIRLSQADKWLPQRKRQPRRKPPKVVTDVVLESLPPEVLSAEFATHWFSEAKTCRPASPPPLPVDASPSPSRRALPPPSKVPTQPPPLPPAAVANMRTTHREPQRLAPPPLPAPQPARSLQTPALARAPLSVDIDDELDALYRAERRRSRRIMLAVLLLPLLVIGLLIFAGSNHIVM